MREFDYRMWSDEEIDEFVKRHEPEFYLNTYVTYPYAIQRVDSFRYVLMYHLGGIYIDIDNGCNRPFREIIATLESLDPDSPHLAAFAIDEDVGLTNDFIISTPGHPIHKQLISRLHSFNHYFLIPYLTVVLSTGPLFLRIQERLFNASQEHIVRLLDPFVYHPSLLWKTRGGMWYGLDAKLIIYIYYNCGHICTIFLSIFIIVILLRRRQRRYFPSVLPFNRIGGHSVLKDCWLQ